MRGKPLCMELYPLLFSSCRIPGPKHDYVSHHRRSPTHITVVRNYQVRSQRFPPLCSAPLCLKGQEEPLAPTGLSTPENGLQSGEDLEPGPIRWRVNTKQSASPRWPVETASSVHSKPDESSRPVRTSQLLTVAVNAVLPVGGLQQRRLSAHRVPDPQSAAPNPLSVLEDGQGADGHPDQRAPPHLGTGLQPPADRWVPVQPVLAGGLANANDVILELSCCTHENGNIQ